MIKVALFVHAFPSPEHPYILDWAKHLANTGIDLTIFAERAGGSTPDALRGRFWERVHYLNSVERPWKFFFRNSALLLRNMLEIPRAVRILRDVYPDKPLSVLRALFEYLPLLGRRFDIVHLNAPQLAVRRFELGRLLDGKTLVSFRGQDFSFDATRFTPLLEKADHLHFISGHLLDLAGKQGYAGWKHTLIPPLVDLEFYRPADAPVPAKSKSDRWELFTAARFSWTKGWEISLQAISLLVKQGWDIHYFVAGHGDFRDAILYTVQELRLQERVHFLGWLNDGELVCQMQRSDLYLLASVEEGFNNSVLQAQACALPVVCSDAGGLSENIEDGVTGLLFHRRDAWDMADKIQKILQDPELRVHMGRSGRVRAESLFSMRAGVSAFTEMYQGLAD